MTSFLDINLLTGFPASTLASIYSAHSKKKTDLLKKTIKSYYSFAQNSNSFP